MFGNTQLRGLTEHKAKILLLPKTRIQILDHLIIIKSWEKSYKEFAFVDVFAPAIGIFNLLAKDKRHLEEEEVTLSALSDQSLRVPDLEGLLEDQFSLRLNVLIKTLEDTEDTLSHITYMHIFMCMCMWV